MPKLDNWLPSSDNWLTESDNCLPESDNCTGNTVVDQASMLHCTFCLTQPNHGLVQRVNKAEQSKHR